MAKIVQNPRLQNRCLYCDKLFRTIADCLTHIKTKHEINRPKMDKNVSKPSINTDIVEMLANCPDENGYITMHQFKKRKKLVK